MLKNYTGQARILNSLRIDNNNDSILIKRLTFIKSAADLFSTTEDSTTTDEDTITETGNLQYVQWHCKVQIDKLLI